MEKAIGQLMKEFTKKWHDTGFYVKGVMACSSVIKTEHSKGDIGYVHDVEVTVELK